MLYDIDPKSKKKLAARIAAKSGLTHEHAERFLDAFSEIMEEDAKAHRVFGHQITIPVVQHPNGSIAVDMSGYSTLWPSAKTKPQTTAPTPRPTPAKRRGGFPGPSFSIPTRDLLSKDLKIDVEALSKFRGALGSKRSSGGLKYFSEMMVRDKLRDK